MRRNDSIKLFFIFLIDFLYVTAREKTSKDDFEIFDQLVRYFNLRSGEFLLCFERGWIESLVVKNISESS